MTRYDYLRALQASFEAMRQDIVNQYPPQLDIKTIMQANRQFGMIVDRMTVEPEQYQQDKTRIAE